MRRKRVRSPKQTMREAQTKRKRPPKSVARSDRATQEWKRSWRSFVINKLSVEAVVDVAIQYWQDSFRASHGPAKPRSESSPDTLERFVGFASRCKKDLIYLTKHGANPVITIGLVVLDDVWLPSSMGPVHEHRDAEIRKLSSVAFWRRKITALKYARGELMDFESLLYFRMSVLYGRVDDSSRRKHPTIRLFEEIVEVIGSIDRVLTRIKRLRLKENDRVLWKEGMFLATRRSDKASKGMKGGVRRYEWENCAFDLARYFEKRTGRPQWNRIARLLHFAGLGKFPGVLHGTDLAEDTERVVENEVDKVRNRVKKLRRSIGKEAHDFHLSSLEEHYETRARLKKFEGGWTLVERIEV